MNCLAMIAEQKIQQAMKDGDFCSPKWQNRPLVLDDDRFVPDDLKQGGGTGPSQFQKKQAEVKTIIPKKH